MTIKIYSDRIEIGDYTLFEGNGGLQFDGVARAENFKGGAGTFQGSIAGYANGGNPARLKVIDKFPFATDSDATDVGDLNQDRYNSANPGLSSETNGYVASGSSAPTGINNSIEKYPFATDTNASVYTGLSSENAGNGTSGQSSATHGYVSGGYAPATNLRTDTIQRFSFFQDTSSTDVGNLTQARNGVSGHSSTTFGYASGGVPSGPTNVNTIDKFPFATDGNATDVGDLTAAKRSHATQSSTTHGYSAGGNVAGPTSTNIIDKFPFSTDTNATDVGDLLGALEFLTGQSSITSGYTSGGSSPTSNVIQKFPFATNSNTSDVGNLTIGTYFCVGTQH